MIVNFIKRVIAEVNGDEAEVIALKNSVKAETAIKSYIANLRNDIVDSNIDLTEANEEYDRKLYPSEVIGKGQQAYKQYVEDIMNAADKIDDIKEDIESYENTIIFLNDILDKHSFNS